MDSIADGVALSLLAWNQGNAGLASEGDGRMTHKDFIEGYGFGTCQIGETEAQHGAAETHTDGITQRQVLGIDGLTTIGNRGGSTPAGHPFAIVCHIDAVFISY